MANEYDKLLEQIQAEGQFHRGPYESRPDYSAYLLAGSAAVVLALAYFVFKKRLLHTAWEKPAETGKGFVAGIAVWSAIVAGYVVIAEPYGSRLDDGELLNAGLLVVLPPVCALLGYLWWRRFVRRKA